MDNIYTNRKIAILTDSHALLEPTKAALEDIARRGITEIYSLGDNVGIGPNPSEVMNLLSDYGVKSIAGNHEEYINLGIEPFSSYFSSIKERSHLWTVSKLNERQIGEIKLFPKSIELFVGGKNIALCHFANDVRFDFDERSTWSYQSDFDFGDAYKQFLYTNSEEQIKEMNRIINIYGKDSPMVRGYLSAKDNPLFRGHRVSFYDAIIQGHVHYKLYEHGGGTDYYSIRAVGIGHKDEPIDTASYVILSERENNIGFDLEEILVKYDRDKMIYSILNSDNPYDLIKDFVGIRR